MIFKKLPLGAKKALIQYFAIDCTDEAFDEIIGTLSSSNLSDTHWQALIEHADLLWGENEYSLSLLPIDTATDFIMKYSPELLDEHGSYDAYHKDYYGEHVPNHKDNSWPVLAMPSCDEALLDGWHRFSSYVRDGYSEIYFINLDKIAIEANENYLISTELKAAIGTEVDTNSGKAVIVSVCGKYGTLEYKNCDGIGWIDVSKLNKE